MSYVVGFVAAVPAANKEEYRAFAESAVNDFKGFGVTRMVEGWGDDVPSGVVTDFRRAVKATDDEVVAFSFHEYPDAETATAANEAMMNDPAMADMQMPFDGARMIYGGFEIILDHRTPGTTGYIDGSVIAVPTARRDAYIDYVTRVAGILAEHGAVRAVDAWGAYVPEGQVTDFPRAVAARPDETVVFTWVEWPSKETRDAAWQTIYSDPRMEQGEPIYDEGRRIFGGFVPILDR